MRTKVFYDLPESACYGCRACAQICPVNAIEMHADREGFLFPEIDTDKCIGCDLCEKTCPTQNSVINPLFYKTPENVDAAWEKNLTDRLNSTSGGVFYAIAYKWIADGGVAYGAAFDDHLVIKHIRVSQLEELKRLRGSKYVQSDVTNTYVHVRTDLRHGLKVLYSGTPCQIAGLRAFLKKDYEKLLTIDLVCHGVPSPLMFREHLNYQRHRYGKAIVCYQFRSKKLSGWRSYIKYIFEGGNSKSFFWGGDFFAYCFYRAFYNRKSCFQCGFSRSSRVGDITLSDFWNAENKYGSLRKVRKYGFNMVMCNTSKGRCAYEKAIEKLNHMSLPTEIAIKGDVRLRHAEPMPAERNTIFNEYFEHGYDWLVANHWSGLSLKSRIIPTWIKNLIYELKARL